jgi:hypothetical protein
MAPLGRSLADTIIYELHVGGFTPSPTSGVRSSSSMRPTAISGYNPVGHFAPHADLRLGRGSRDLVRPYTALGSRSSSMSSSTHERAG